MGVTILNTFLRPIFTVTLVWNTKKLVTCITNNFDRTQQAIYFVKFCTRKVWTCSAFVLTLRVVELNWIELSLLGLFIFTNCKIKDMTCDDTCCLIRLWARAPLHELSQISNRMRSHNLQIHQAYHGSLGTCTSPVVLWNFNKQPIAVVSY